MLGFNVFKLEWGTARTMPLDLCDLKLPYFASTITDMQDCLPFAIACNYMRLLYFIIVSKRLDGPMYPLGVFMHAFDFICQYTCMHFDEFGL